MTDEKTDISTSLQFMPTGMKTMADSERPGMAIAMDALAEEIRTTDSLLATLTNAIGPVLLDTDSMEREVPRPNGGGSDLQKAVWDKAFSLAQLNDHIRSLLPRIDV